MTKKKTASKQPARSHKKLESNLHNNQSKLVSEQLPASKVTELISYAILFVFSALHKVGAPKLFSLRPPKVPKTGDPHRPRKWHPVSCNNLGVPTPSLGTTAIQYHHVLILCSALVAPGSILTDLSLRLPVCCWCFNMSCFKKPVIYFI